MNVELTDTGGTVTGSGNQGQYGKVYITYNMSLSPNSTSQGSFTGKAMAIDNDGNRNAAIRGGVWKREGNKMTMHSLDDVTDGNQFLCKSILDLRTGKFEMTFYGMQQVLGGLKDRPPLQTPQPTKYLTTTIYGQVGGWCPALPLCFDFATFLATF